MELVISAIVGFLQAFVLERLKDSAWFPFMDWTSRHRNVITPIISIVVAASGINWTWDEVHGALTISGLVPNDILRALVTAAVGYASSQTAYHKLVK